MHLPNAARWQGVEHVYTLPWVRNRVELTADPERVAAYSRGRFTRSAMLMNLLRQFHLSNNSILVGSDQHSAFLRGALIRQFPDAQDYSEIARDLIERIFDRSRYPGETNTMRVSATCVRELYPTLLRSILGVRILPPLRAFIDDTDFSPGWRPLRLEAFMYSLGLHSPFFAPLRAALDLLFFREARRMRKISRKLERLVYFFTEPEPASWFEELHGYLVAGRISRAQFRGEITSMLVSSFSVASALSFSLLCLAARPRFVDQIREDPGFAKHFLAEVLRLYPPFHQFGYQRSAGDPEADREGNTDFLISAYYLHRNPGSWRHAEYFRPERFALKEKHDRFGYLPFGMGPRICPGRSYSMRLLVEVVKYVCSEASPVNLLASEGLPAGRSDRVISFPVDDELNFAFNAR